MKTASSTGLCSKPFQRRAIALVAFLLLLVVALPHVVSRGESQSQAGRASQRANVKSPKRILVISLDGLDARYLNQRDEFNLKIPTLRRLMAEGVAARGVVSVYPSVTYPAHTSIVTGAYPSRHGIMGNETIGPPLGTESREWYWYARDIRAETLWDAAKRRGLKVGMVSWPVGVGAGDYNAPEILKFGGTLPQTLARIKENARPAGLIDEIEKRDPELYKSVTKDEQDDMRTRMAEYILTEKRPEVMLVHLFDLDHFQHDYGPFTKEAFAMLEKSDAYVGRMLEALRRAGTLADTAVFIVSDHGFKPISKLLHPGVALERAGLIEVRDEGKDKNGKERVVVTDWRAMPYITNGSCAIILRDPTDRETAAKVREIFKMWGEIRRLAGLSPSIKRVIEAKELKAMGSNTRALLMLEAADGYSFGSNYTGELTTASTQRGAHGYLPTEADYNASFIASGPSVNRRNPLGLIRMIDIGPTIARTLNLRLRDAQGQALALQGTRRKAR